MIRIVLIAGMLCCGLQLGVCAPPDTAISLFTVDFAARHQVMDNFGANDAWYLQAIGATWSETNKNRIADLLFSTDKGIGLSCWRFNLGAGINRQTIHDRLRTVETFEVADGQYDWSRQAGQRWFLRAAKARGVRQFIATVYSPPLRLTRNGLSNLGSDKTSTTNLRLGGEEAFARYLTDIVLHFRDNPEVAERVEFDFVAPVNEPQWDWQGGQEGNRASNADLKRIYTTLAQRLKQCGLKTKILGPESGSIPDMYSLNAKAREKWDANYGDYLRFVCSVPQVAEWFGGVVSYHSYWSDKTPDELVPHRMKLAQARAKFPGWKLWQSEYCIMEHGRDLGMDAALRVARIIHCDLTIVGAASWQWWLAVAGEDYKSGLIYIDYPRTGAPETIHESKLLWTLGNFSRFIRPGMQRIELRGDKPFNLDGVLGSAYLNQQNGQMAVVFVNMNEQAESVRLVPAMFPGYSISFSRFTPYTTSATDNLRAGEPVDVATGLTLPPRSVTTLVGVATAVRNLGQTMK